MLRASLGPALSHWSTLFEEYQTSSLEFYTRVDFSLLSIPRLPTWGYGVNTYALAGSRNRKAPPAAAPRWLPQLSDVALDLDPRRGPSPRMSTTSQAGRAGGGPLADLTHPHPEGRDS